jgi:hypothetical protein
MPDSATIDQIIHHLQELRAKHGGDSPVTDISFSPYDESQRRPGLSFITVTFDHGYIERDESDGIIPY